MTRLTSDNISSLKENEIFVFGSNLSGFHGGGAARIAVDWGAVWGQGEGLQGQTYAIPTKYYNIERSLTIEEIKPFVDLFIEFAKQNPEYTFLVTEIGCGLAGYNPTDIAPLFQEAIHVDNIYLPNNFWDVLNGKDYEGQNNFF